MAATETPMRASCHCGAITVTVNRLPEYINHCQCTICRRYGAAWGYYYGKEVKIETKPDAETRKYSWGDKGSSFNFCGNCGCMCYWWRDAATTDGEGDKMGLNTNNINPELLRFVNRAYEYAQQLVPLDAGKGAAHPDDVAKY